MAGAPPPWPCAIGNESFLVLFFRKDPRAGLRGGRAQKISQQALLFAKRSKNSHFPS
jgi:hypothetical protein